MNSNNNEPWFGAKTPNQNLGSGLVLNFWGMIAQVGSGLVLNFLGMIAQVGSSFSLKPKN